MSHANVYGVHITPFMTSWEGDEPSCALEGRLCAAWP